MTLLRFQMDLENLSISLHSVQKRCMALLAYISLLFPKIDKGSVLLKLLTACSVTDFKLLMVLFACFEVQIKQTDIAIF